jgi:hypothetical protein
MWSHYADSHRGICIGFSKNNDYFQKAIPIKYRRYRTSLNGVDITSLVEPKAITKLVCLEKSIDWAYEEEERLFWDDLGENITFSGKDLNGNEVFLNEYPKEAIKSVYIGINASRETIIEILKIVSNFDEEVEVFLCQKYIEEFKINFLKIDKALDKVLTGLENR